jgi:preprotein translocase subunit SecA
MRRDEVKEVLKEAVNKRYEEKEAKVGEEVMRLHEKYILLQVIDQLWKDHLLMIDHLKEGIGLRGYGQRDPLIEYKKESFELFQEMNERIQDRVVKFLWKVDVVVEREGEERVERPQQRLPQPPKQQPMFFSGGQAEQQTVKRREAKVGRNDPCPCGSGKKYKKCHGAAA